MLPAEQGDYLVQLFLDWLRLPQARAVWEDVFRVQTGTWPVGFVDLVDGGLGAPSSPA